eukprot:5487299-Pyramimonas_sp.AAC.2
MKTTGSERRWGMRGWSDDYPCTRHPDPNPTSTPLSVVSPSLYITPMGLICLMGIVPIFISEGQYLPGPPPPQIPPQP